MGGPRSPINPGPRASLRRLPKITGAHRTARPVAQLAMTPPPRSKPTRGKLAKATARAEGPKGKKQKLEVIGQPAAEPLRRGCRRSEQTRHAGLYPSRKRPALASSSSVQNTLLSRRRRASVLSLQILELYRWQEFRPVAAATPIPVLPASTCSTHYFQCSSWLSNARGGQTGNFAPGNDAARKPWSRTGNWNDVAES